MNENSKHIYIADDETNIREAIKTFLENDGYAVTAFETGDALLTAFKINSCDLIILDVMMPGSSGFTICKALREISTVPIIMLTARDSDLDYATGLSLGSDDYFTKPFSAMSLVMRVKAIFRRIEFDKANLVKTHELENLILGNIIVNQSSKEVTCGDKKIDLTPNEFSLLSYLIKNYDKAVSRDELLENLWGISSDVETRAADDTVRRLRKKLAISNVSIDTVWGFGFRMKVDDDNV